MSVWKNTVAEETLAAFAKDNGGSINNENKDAAAKAVAEAVNKTAKTAAERVKVTARMVQSKASSMKIYAAGVGTKQPESAGEQPARKIQIVNAVETLLSLPKNSLDTLEKASKAQLQKLANALVQLSEQENIEHVEKSA